MGGDPALGGGVTAAVPGSGRRRRVLVTGGAGTVAGWLARTVPDDVELHLTCHVSPVPADVRGVSTVHRVDLLDPDATVALVTAIRPDVVVHTAYVQERRESIVDLTRWVADATALVGASLVHLSTDVVFAGGDPPYGEDATPDPVSDYGRSKAEAERICRRVVPDACIVRISMAVSLDPPDRVTASLLDALSSGAEVTLYRDEHRQPIRAEDLARELWALVGLNRVGRAGVWHLPGPECLSRLELGLRLAAALGLDTAGVRTASAASHPSPRPRDPAMAARRREVLGVTLAPVDVVGAPPGG